jgi:glycosyltransferase involved in cell wall biosynthesis
MLPFSRIVRPSIITRADRAREARQWDIAARHYRKVLRRDPRNWPIWVQYGHALKESGKLAEAEAAYRRALSYDQVVADSHLQLGHVLKLQQRIEEAEAAYLCALKLDGLSGEPLRELATLGWSESKLLELGHWTSAHPNEAAAALPASRSPECTVLAASKLFDATYYRERNPAVDFSKIDPLTHYISIGYKEGRAFHPLFDVSHYINSRGTMTRSDNPLIDFITTPVGERVNPVPFFDPDHYCETNHDIAQNGVCPYEHLLLHGMHEPHRSINAIVSPYYIWSRYPSVQFSNINAGGYYLTQRTDAQMRFIFVGHEASRTGAPLILLRIVQYFSSWSNVDSFVILDRGGPLVHDYQKFAHVMVVNSDLHAPTDNADRVKKISYLLDRTEGGITAALCNSLESREYGKELALHGIPVVVLAHEMPQVYPPALLREVSWAKKIIVPATCLREQYCEIFPEIDRKILVMPQGLLSWNFGRIGRAQARKAVLKELGLPEDAVIVIGCGTVDTRKGTDWFAYVGRLTQKSLAKENSVYFIWIGAAHYESRLFWTQMEVEKWDLQNRVRFIGERTDVEKYFVAADIFLLTSRIDPFPCVVHEAMAAHLAIVAFDGTGGAPEQVAEGAGIVVPFGDVEAMAQAVVELAGNGERRRQLGDAAARRVAEKYSFTRYAAGLMGLVGAELGLDNEDFGEHRLLPAERSRPRIIFSAGDWEISGVNSATDYLANRLIELGYDTTILFTRGRFGNLDDRRMPSSPYEFLQPKNETPAAIWESVQAYLRECAPCVFVPNYDYLASAVSAVLPPSVGIVGIAWADDVEHYEHCYRLGLYWNRIVAVSKAIRDGLVGINPALAAKTTIIHPGVPIFPLAERGREPVTAARPLRLVYTGRLVQRQKRILDYVALARRLEQSGIPFHLTLAGKSPNDDFDRVAGELSSMIKRGIVALPGKLDPKDIRALLNNADVFLLLSEFEGLSVSLLEAMERGCIPLVYDMKSGISEVLEDGRNSYIVASKNLAGVVDRVAEIAADVSLRQRLSKAARDTIISGGWSDQAMAERYHAVFSEVLTEASSGAYIRPEPLTYMSPIGGIIPPPMMFRSD